MALHATLILAVGHLPSVGLAQKFAKESRLFTKVLILASSVSLCKVDLKNKTIVTDAFRKFLWYLLPLPSLWGVYSSTMLVLAWACLNWDLLSYIRVWIPTMEISAM